MDIRNRQFYYVDLKDGKFRIFKDYIDSIQEDSIEENFKVYFKNGIIRPHNEVYEQRREARQARDKKNKKLFIYIGGQYE